MKSGSFRRGGGALKSFRVISRQRFGLRLTFTCFDLMRTLLPRFVWIFVMISGCGFTAAAQKAPVPDAAPVATPAPATESAGPGAVRYKSVTDSETRHVKIPTREQNAKQQKDWVNNMPPEQQVLLQSQMKHSAPEAKKEKTSAKAKPATISSSTTTGGKGPAKSKRARGF
jgi:hypothetical protein